MNTIHQKTEAVATRVWTEGRMVSVELTDQRIVGFPAHRFRRLKEASEAELAEITPATEPARQGGGEAVFLVEPEVELRESVALNVRELSPFGLHWPTLDEDLSFEGILAGRYGQR
jgi:hypothetical protein